MLKTVGLGALLDVEMSKKCTALWREAHLEVSGWMNGWIDRKIDSLIEGSLEVKLPTIWRDEKQSRAEAEIRGRLAERRSEEKE